MVSVCWTEWKPHAVSHTGKVQPRPHVGQGHSDFSKSRPGALISNPPHPIHFLLPYCRCDVASCLLLQPPTLCRHGRTHPQLRAQISPSIAFCEVFDHGNEKRTRDSVFLHLQTERASWIETPLIKWPTIIIMPANKRRPAVTTGKTTGRKPEVQPREKLDLVTTRLGQIRILHPDFQVLHL